MKKINSRTLYSIFMVFVLICIFVIGGCSSGSSFSKEQNLSDGGDPYEFASDKDIVAAEQAYSPDATMNSQIVASSEPSLNSNNNQINVPGSRKLIKTVDLSIEATEFTALIEKISQKVGELEGYIESSNISGNSMSYYSNKKLKSAYIIARIPSNKLDNFVTIVESSGNVTSKSQNVSDVTLQYSDIESMQKTLKVEQERLWELLEKAESVDAIITIESRLSEIRYQLESYESQLRLYDNEVDYSTVTISVDEVEVLTPTDPESTGTRITNGLKATILSIKTAFTDLLVLSIVKSPIIIICAVLILIIILIYNRITRHSKKKNMSHESKKETDKVEDNKIEIK